MLDAFRRRLADQDSVVAAHIVRDRVVEPVAADAHRRRVDDAVQRDHRDLGGAAADVEHHRAARLVHRHAGADRRGHRLLDEIHLTRARAFGGLADRTPLDLCRPVRHADEHARARPEVARAVRLLDEVLEHLLRHAEVGDHAVLEGTNRGDVPRRPAEHVLRFLTNGLEYLAAAAGLLPDRDDGRLVENDALAADVDQGVSGAEIDGQIVGKIPEKTL